MLMRNAEVCIRPLTGHLDGQSQASKLTEMVGEVKVEVNLA